jgi:hypothetical protein
METDLISKKDLLAETGISYGQLYRWKRKGLIPEDWFVRKATFTGQETFFPRDKMVARVGRILSMKGEELSLDDIAEAVTPDLAGISLSADDAIERGIISKAAAEVFSAVRPDLVVLRYGELLAAYVADSLLLAGDVTADEAGLVFGALVDGLPDFEGREVDAVVVRKTGVAVCVLVSSGAHVRFDDATRMLTRVNLQETTEALGARLK